jgi:OHCU decarboxylase
MTMANLDEPHLLECCGSTSWVQAILEARPFASLERLEAAATECWWRLRPSDWLEAFSKHPKIGEKNEVSAWSAQEQRGMNSAPAQVTERLAEMNRLYFEKFGWIFIVCATGKSAEEMLSLLESRLSNGPEEELGIAAAEQSKITLLRLKKLLA